MFFLTAVASKTLHNCVHIPIRNAKILSKINWVRPQHVPKYDPQKTGDLEGMKIADGDCFPRYFRDCDLLSKCANEEVKKIFMLKKQDIEVQFNHYKAELIDKVKVHEWDTSSLESQIAEVTAEIRFKQYIICNQDIFKMHKVRKSKKQIPHLVAKRTQLLEKLREINYKKFEWVLEQLNFKYIPQPINSEKVTRKNATKLLSRLKMEKLKEARLAQYKAELDKLKIPFLEKKIEKLYWIKEQESNLNLEPSVSDSDIEHCKKRLESVKLEVAERQSKGYLRKVHPYTLELYGTQPEKVEEV